MENYNHNQIMAEMEALMYDEMDIVSNMSHTTGNGSTAGPRVTNYQKVEDMSVF
jgi:hypothetical protein